MHKAQGGKEMKNYYFVDFKWDDVVYCSNIVHAKTKEEVERYYKEKYGWCSVRNVQYGELEIAKRKGMPFIEM